MNRKIFNLPKPKLIQEAKPKSRNSVIAGIGKRDNLNKLPARPFRLHQCMKHGGESNCSICRSFINSNSKPIIKYTERDLRKELPLKEKKCRGCKKKFKTRFDAKDCSDKCCIKYLGLRSLSNARYFKKHYLKSARNFVK